MPIGAPSSEFTGWLRRYSWSSRRSSTWQLPKQVDDERRRARACRQEVQARLVQHADHFAEQHVDAAGPLLHDGVEAEEARTGPAAIGSSEERADEDDQPAAMRSVDVIFRPPG